jgi:hypothetical protein
MHSRLKPVIFSFTFAAASALLAQAPCTPVTFTADQDHQNMMDQLGIKTLRPGWSGNENAPNHANYDESKANPYPNVPDPLTMNDGQPKSPLPKCGGKIAARSSSICIRNTSTASCPPRMCPRLPGPSRLSITRFIGFTPVIAKDLVGEVDNSGCSAISVKIHMTVVTPANAKGPVPVLMDVYPRRLPQSQRATRRGIRQASTRP